MKREVLLAILLSIFILVILLNIYCVSALRINEVNANTPEFVEIYNDNNSILNLSDWRIRDNYEEDKIICAIQNCSLVINDSYFVIFGNNTNISLLTNISISYFYVNDNNGIGNGLANKDNLTFFHSNLSLNLTDFYSWNNSSSGKSWQFYNQTWQACEPTPGRENNCSTTCIQNWSCSAWSSCINGLQTRSCSDLNNCLNLTGKPAENQACTSNTNQTQQNKINIYLDYEYENYNDKEIKVTLDAENLENYDYDIKIYIEYDKKVISQIYDEEDDKWISGRYYVSAFSGPGENSEKFSLRLNEDNKNFTGEADIIARLRKAGSSSYEEESDTIKFIKKAEKKIAASSAISSDVINLDINQSESVIKLSKGIKSYKSKLQYIKEYSIYGFTLFLAIVLGLVFVLRWKKIQA